MKNNRWANFNGPGKPITEKQVEEILSREFGIEPVRFEDGRMGYKREQIEQAIKILSEKRDF
jgi:hypothetical protein